MRPAAALTGLAGLAFAALALAVPTPAAASVEDDWKACVAPGTVPAERITRCDAAIASGALKPAPLAQALTGRAFARAAQKDFIAAIADFDAALEQHADATAFYYRGLALEQVKQADRALADYDRAIALNPKNGAYYRARALNHSKRKDFQRAIADVTAALGLSTRPQVEYMLRGSYHDEAGERDKAIADYQKVLEIDPDDMIVRNELGRLGGTVPDSAQLPPGACSANDISHEERVAGCTAVIESGKTTGWALKTAHCNRGYALTELREYDRVIADSDAAIRLDDKLACAYLNRGRAWYYKHDLDRATADYTQAIKSDGRFHEAYASRGTAYFDRRDFAHAIADYDMAIAIDPSVAMYISDRGNTRLQMGEKERAIADFSHAIEVDPDYAAAYIRRGWALLASDDLERAEADFAKALQLSPGDSGAQSGRIAVLERRNPAQAAAEKEAEKRAGFERLRSLVDQQHGKSAP